MAKSKLWPETRDEIKGRRLTIVGKEDAKMSSVEDAAKRILDQVNLSSKSEDEIEEPGEQAEREFQQMQDVKTPSRRNSLLRKLSEKSNKQEPEEVKTLFDIVGKSRQRFIEMGYSEEDALILTVSYSVLEVANSLVGLRKDISDLLK